MPETHPPEAPHAPAGDDPVDARLRVRAAA